MSESQKDFARPEENDKVISLDGNLFLCKKMVMTDEETAKMKKKFIPTFDTHNFINTQDRCPEGQYFNFQGECEDDSGEF